MTFTPTIGELYYIVTATDQNGHVISNQAPNSQSFYLMTGLTNYYTYTFSIQSIYSNYTSIPSISIPIQIVQDSYMDTAAVISNPNVSIISLPSVQISFNYTSSYFQSPNFIIYAYNGNCQTSCSSPVNYYIFPGNALTSVYHYTINNLIIGNTYTFYIYAFTDTNMTKMIAKTYPIILGYPTDPTNIIVSQTNNNVIITFNPSLYAASYYLEIDNSSQSYDIPSSQTQFIISNLSPTTHSFGMKAYNSNGDSNMIYFNFTVTLYAPITTPIITPITTQMPVPTPTPKLFLNKTSMINLHEMIHNKPNRIHFNHHGGIIDGKQYNTDHIIKSGVMLDYWMSNKNIHMVERNHSWACMISKQQILKSVPIHDLNEKNTLYYFTFDVSSACHIDKTTSSKDTSRIYYEISDTEIISYSVVPILSGDFHKHKEFHAYSFMYLGTGRGNITISFYSDSEEEFIATIDNIQISK